MKFRIIKFFKKLVNILIYFLKSKRIYKKPTHKKILIFAKDESHNIIKYFDKDEYDILDIRGHNINIYIVILTIFKFGFSNLIKNYSQCYVDTVQPNFLITFVDNNLNFYKIKSNGKYKLKKIAIQNAYRRDTHPDLFSKFDEVKKENLRADYILCFNKKVGKFYSELFDCVSLPIGSFKNNLFPKLNKELNFDGKKTFLFVSQFRPKGGFDTGLLRENDKNFFPKPLVEEHALYNKSDYNLITYSDFYQTENFLLPIVFDFCLKKNYLFKINFVFPSSHRYFNEELEFYKTILPRYIHEAKLKENKTDSYKNMNSSDVIVNIDSTMGYEALARGLKTITFINRPVTFKRNLDKFAWPNDFGKKGKIWTTQLSELEINRLLKYIDEVDELEWNNYINTIKSDMMEFDYDNKIFQNIIGSK